MIGRNRSIGRDLRRLLGREAVLDDVATIEAVSRDATPDFSGRPDVVVKPRDTTDVVSVVDYARRRGIPIVPRGAGSNLCAGTVPIRGGIVMSTARMRSIREVAPGEMLAVVEPGVTTAELDESAAAHGLMFAPDPSSRSVATVGGNVATCAGGLRGLKYGNTRHHILGLEVVIGTGEVIRTGGRLAKDVAGYDLTRLMVGSEGTLGVITEVTAALVPKPASSGYGVAYFDDLSAAGAAVDGIITSGIVPATLEFLDSVCISVVEEYAQLGLDTDAGALLLFGDDGHPDAVADTVERMRYLCSASPGAISAVVAPDDRTASALLHARRCSLPALARHGSHTVLEDVSVPRQLIPEAVRRIRAIGHRHDVLIGVFGHAGDGNLHPTVVIDGADSRARERCRLALDEIFRVALDLGGSITGEHGVGAAKLGYLEEQLGSAQVELMRRVKAAFDPCGVMNPGKVGS